MKIQAHSFSLSLFHLRFYKEVANMHAYFVLSLQSADTYLSKHRSGSEIGDEGNIKLSQLFTK